MFIEGIIKEAGILAEALAPKHTLIAYQVSPTDFVWTAAGVDDLRESLEEKIAPGYEPIPIAKIELGTVYREAPWRMIILADIHPDLKNINGSPETFNQWLQDRGRQGVLIEHVKDVMAENFRSLSWDEKLKLSRRLYIDNS